jgi:hypothetical protein
MDHYHISARLRHESRTAPLMDSVNSDAQSHNSRVPEKMRNTQEVVSFQLFISFLHFNVLIATFDRSRRDIQNHHSVHLRELLLWQTIKGHLLINHRNFWQNGPGYSRRLREFGELEGPNSRNFDLNANTSLSQVALKSEQQIGLAIFILDSQSGDGWAIGSLCAHRAVIGLCTPLTFHSSGCLAACTGCALTRVRVATSLQTVDSPPEEIDALVNMKESITCVTHLSMTLQPVWEESSLANLMACCSSPATGN